MIEVGRSGRAGCYRPGRRGKGHDHGGDLGIHRPPELDIELTSARDGTKRTIAAQDHESLLPQTEVTGTK